MKLEGDCGGRTIINQMEESATFVPIESTSIGIDIDTREDYERITTLA